MDPHHAVAGVAGHAVQVSIVERLQDAGRRIQSITAGSGRFSPGQLTVFGVGLFDEIVGRPAAGVQQFLDERRFAAFGQVDLALQPTVDVVMLNQFRQVLVRQRLPVGLRHLLPQFFRGLAAHFSDFFRQELLPVVDQPDLVIQPVMNRSDECAHVIFLPMPLDLMPPPVR